MANIDIDTRKRLNETLNSINYCLSEDILVKNRPMLLKGLSMIAVAIKITEQEAKLAMKLIPQIHENYSYEMVFIENFLKCSKEMLQKFICFTRTDLNNYLKAFANPHFTTEIKIVILEHICWTQQGTINKLKTAKDLIEKSNLSNITKYIIACNNCLISDIKNLLITLPKNFLQEFVEDKEFRIVVFWTCYVTEEHKWFARFVKQDSNIKTDNTKYILKWAITYRREVAVQYIWENLVRESTKINIVDYAVYALKMNCPKIVLYFTSLMSEKEFYYLCQKDHKSIIGLINEDYRFRDFVPNITEYIFCLTLGVNPFIGSPMFFVKYCIDKRILSSKYHSEMAKRLLESFHFKSPFVLLWFDYLYPFLSEGYTDTMKLILNRFPIEERKKYLKSPLGMQNFTDFVFNNS